MSKKPAKKPAAKRPAGSNPAAAKPADIKAVEQQTATSKEAIAASKEQDVSATAKVQPLVKTAEAKLAQTKPVETKLTETKPVETKLTKTKPAETKLTETKPAETKLTETKPVETKLAESKPAKTALAETTTESKLTSPPEKAAAQPKSTKSAEEKPAPKRKTATRTSKSTKAKAAEEKTAKPRATRSKSASAKTEKAAPVEKAPAKSVKKAEATKTDTVKKAPAIDEEKEFLDRFNRYLDEFKWLYMELYNDEARFDELNYNLHEIYKGRSAALKELDRKREQKPNWYRQTDMLGMELYADLFHKNLDGVGDKLDYLQELGVRFLHLMSILKTPYNHNDDGFTISDFRAVREDLGGNEQMERLAEACRAREITLCIDFDLNHTSVEHEWAQRALQGESDYEARYLNHWDLNYRNPVVFNEMVYHLLYLANLGVDAFQLHDLNLLDTRSHSFPKVHSLTRMLRIVCEIVCPGVLLKCTTGMNPQDAIPFLGTQEKPECHMVYDTLMTSCVWNALATRDVRLLKGQLDVLPQEGAYINLLRNYDPLRWEMDDDPLSWQGFDPYLHRKFLFDFYDGSYEDSFAKGAQFHAYEDDGSCGTTASFCGIEKALEEEDNHALNLAIERDLMLHALLLTLPGTPMLYSGDEVGQLNDYSYQQDAFKAQDNRFIHRGAFQWEKAEKRGDKNTVEGTLFQSIRNLQDIRSKHEVFAAQASWHTVETGDVNLLELVRELDGKKLVAIFNFCEAEKEIDLEDKGMIDLIAGAKAQNGKLDLAPYQAVWMYQEA